MNGNIFDNISSFFDMLLAAIASVFLTLLFRGGPSILYSKGKFRMKRLVWLFIGQFIGSITVYVLTSYLFCTEAFKEFGSYKLVVTFLAAIMPVEITLVILIVLVQRFWTIIMKKVDPNFSEENPLDKIYTIASIHNNKPANTYLPDDEEETEVNKNNETNDDNTNANN